jgi:cytoskeletal protein CcmA (bactofilin family)
MTSHPYGQTMSPEEDPFDFDDTESGAQSQLSEELDPLPEEVENTGTKGMSRPLSVVGQSLTFTGELFAEEDLLIQGNVRGSITHTGNNLTIGAHGNVKADITAQKIIVQGEVHGDVRASESVVVEASARVTGNIVAPRVGIKEGAKFKGSIDMDVGSASHESSSGAPKRKGGSSRATRDAKQEAEGSLSETGVDRLLG